MLEKRRGIADVSFHQALTDEYLVGFVRILGAEGDVAVGDDLQAKEGNPLLGPRFAPFPVPARPRIRVAAEVSRQAFQPGRVDLGGGAGE